MRDLFLWIPATLAALIHVLIFAMESVWWRSPAVRRRFRMSEADAEATRVFAFNQGFYNLFLAIGMLVGLIAGNATLVAFTASCMLAAAVILLVSSRAMWRGTVIQGGPAALTLLAMLVR
jgi:putative membrane protein